MNTHKQPAGTLLSPPPCYAIFHGEGGYEGEREKARNTFRVGGKYKIIGGTMSQSSTRLEIEGCPGGWNSVLFHYDHKIAPVDFPYLRHNNVISHSRDNKKP